MILLQSLLPIKSITAMVQKEAGVRLCAPLGTREAGAVTVAVNYYSDAKILFNVSRGSFMPAPNVDSCVIRFDIRSDTPKVKDEDYFFRLVRGMFSQRRKTLLNCVSSSMGMDKKMLESAMLSAGIKPSARPEELDMNQMIRLSDELFSRDSNT